jgi:hypothetical protein
LPPEELTAPNNIHRMSLHEYVTTGQILLLLLLQPHITVKAVYTLSWAAVFE